MSPGVIRIDIQRGKSTKTSAKCEVAGKAYHCIGSPAIYKIVTLLSIDGYDGEAFEVFDGRKQILYGKVRDLRGTRSICTGGAALNPAHSIKNHAVEAHRRVQEADLDLHGIRAP